MFGLISTRFLSKAAASVPRVKAAKGPEIPIFGMRTSPFALFVKEGFKSDPKGNGPEKIKELSVQWKKMGDNEKEKFFEQSKILFEEKRKDFLKLSTEEQQSLVQQAKDKKAEQEARKKLKERREKNKLEGRPVQPPNAFALFLKDRLTGCKTDVKEKMKESLVEWNSLGHVEKQKYTDEAKKLSDAYHVNIEKWSVEKKSREAAEKKEAKAKESMEKKEMKPKAKDGMEKKTKPKMSKSS